ncbi:MAG: hypoxanthine phosphoribosyltransferase [Deltaproteobacteria bacterium]|nr:MAG: hypoxanthine phosphoribosyltransferase [Deltaproteobacteria bacterium]
MNELSRDVDVLYDEETLARRVAELGAEITRAYRGDDLTVLVILKGSFVFAADLIRSIDLPLTVDFMGLSSYGAQTESSGVVRITQDLSRPIEGRHVLVVEDIIDTGLTMKYLLGNLATRGPKSTRVCALLHKPARSEHGVEIDYLGFTIPDAFVVGYGLDFDERYRNLPFVGVLKAEKQPG